MAEHDIVYWLLPGDGRDVCLRGASEREGTHRSCSEGWTHGTIPFDPKLMAYGGFQVLVDA